MAALHHFEAISETRTKGNAERTDAWTGRRVGGSSAPLVALRLSGQFCLLALPPVTGCELG